MKKFKTLAPWLVICLLAGSSEIAVSETVLLARTGEPAVSGDGAILGFQSVLHGSTETGQAHSVIVARFGGRTDNGVGVYLAHRGGVTRLFATGEDVVGEDTVRTFNNNFEAMCLNEQGEVALIAALGKEPRQFGGDRAIILAGPGKLVELAREGQPAPDGAGTFGRIDAASLRFNDNGQVAFVSKVSIPKDGTGVFLADESGVKELARTETTLLEGGGVLRGIYSSTLSLSDEGRVVFKGSYDPAGDGNAATAIFIAGHGGMRKLVRAGRENREDTRYFTTLGFSSATRWPSHELDLLLAEDRVLAERYRIRSRSPSSVSTNLIVQADAGQILFSAYLGEYDLPKTNANLPGILRFDGDTMTTLVKQSAPVPGGNGVFGQPQDILCNRAGQIAFWSRVSRSQNRRKGVNAHGIYFVNGLAVTEVACSGGQAPDGNGWFRDLGNMVLNDLGQVAFAAEIADTDRDGRDGAGLFVADGGVVRTVLREGQAAPDGNGSFARFGNLGLDGDGRVLFYGLLEGTADTINDNTGLFISDGETVAQIAREGQAAPGGHFVYADFSTVSHPAHLAPDGSVMFVASLTDRVGGLPLQQGILLADGGEALALARTGTQDVQPSLSALVPPPADGTNAVSYDANRVWHAFRNGRVLAALPGLRSLAEGGDHRAQFTLGTVYTEGVHVDRDDAAGCGWFLAAAEGGHPDAMMKIGDGYGNGRGVEEDDAEAVRWYEQAVAIRPELGLELSQVYDYGRGLPADKARAVHWLRVAAEAGSRPAGKELARRYEIGDGVPVDPREAFRWYRKLAETGSEEGQESPFVAQMRREAETRRWGPISYQAIHFRGDRDAVLSLIRLYDAGAPVPEDAPPLVHWLELAAARDPDAQYRLGMACLEGDTVALDPGRAVLLFAAAARNRHPGALFRLSQLFEAGDEVPQDTTKAASYLRQAADAGHPEAMFREGSENGRQDYLLKSAGLGNTNALVYLGLSADYREPNTEKGGWEAIRESAEQGNANAQYYVAVTYENTYGAHRDPEAARFWMEKAAANGNRKAPMGMYRLLLAARNYPEAIHWLKTAASNDDPSAQFTLGRHYAQGEHGLPHDPGEAYLWYSLSLSNGYSLAYAKHPLDIVRQELSSEQRVDLDRQVQERIEASQGSATAE